ncbi:MAG TPA: M48 family metalloprotease, partial [Agitococcus sp.]|nr:M48 family metalloprotease [Agitococcus sp.]
RPISKEFDFMIRQFCQTSFILWNLFASSLLIADTNSESVLPDLGAFSVNKQQEDQLGQQFLRELRASTAILSDPLIHDYLENLCYRLAFAAQSKHTNLDIVVLPDRNINAFAVAGGVIGINAGLLLYADNEAEVAAVLAHELAHLDLHHYTRSQQAQAGDQWLYLGALLASIALAANSSNNDAGLAVGLSAQAALIDKQLSYSRLHEREADHVGIQTLTNAGFNPQAMADFFSKMDRQARQVGLMPSFLLTHPSSQERNADSTLRSQQYPNKGKVDSLDYQLIRRRLLAIIDGRQADNLAVLQQKLNNNPKHEPTLLSILFTLLNNEQFSQARQVATQLRTISPQRIDYIIAQADIELADQQAQNAVKILEDALLINPQNQTLKMYAAKAAIKAQAYTQAIQWLTSLSYERANDPEVWQSLVECYQAQKEGLQLLRARAEFAFLLGSYDKAISDLEQAKKLATNNYPLLAKIKQRQLVFEQTKEVSKKIK